MWSGRRKATRGFLTASLVALTVPAIIVGWLGWMLLQSDRELDRQRVQERLTNAAILAVGSLEQAVVTTEQHLTAVAEASDSSRAAQIFALGSRPEDAVVVVMSATGLWSSAPLLFYPEDADFSDPTADRFIDGERLEFAGRNLSAAMANYRDLAGSRDRMVRAGALARVARVARKLNQREIALDAYDALVPLGSTTVLGRPADLVASLERCAVLSEMHQSDRLTIEARQLERRLAAGDWRLSKDQFQFYRGLVGAWLGERTAREGDNPTATAREVIAAGVLVARSASKASGSAEAVGGRQTFGAGHDRGLVVWRRSGLSSGSRVAALIATPGYIDRTWFQGLHAIENSQRARISLSGPDGDEWFRASVSGDAIHRTAGDTGLPFTLRVASSDPAGDTATFTGRRRLLGGMVAALGLLVVVGGYVTARGIARELAAARLQSDFVAAVSHEFRTPVASVLQLSELLDEGRVPDECRRTEYYGLLHRESVRLQRLVENLLDFGRMESAAAEYRLTPIHLDALLRQLTGDFANEVRISGRRIDAVLSDGLPIVLADPEALGRAVWNLLDNAAKYSPPDTPITVEADRSAEGVAIRVRDEGPGIPAEEQAHIFDKFVRGASARASGSKGTGLGLAMVKHIVQAHRAVVSVSSQPGAGATFTILLPAVRG
jgi:signal transduction histidine kinase